MRKNNPQKDRERAALKARTKPLQPQQRELLARLKRKGKLVVGHTTATFSPRDRLSQCTPAQASTLEIRDLAESIRPDPRGPRYIVPTKKALAMTVQLAVIVAFCLLVCACGGEPARTGADTLKTTSGGGSGSFEHRVVEVKAGGSTHHVLIVQSTGTGTGVATCKLCTTFEWDGKPYYVDADGEIYKWVRLDKQPE